MKLPALQIVEILKRAGFEEVRQKGSHVFLKHPDGRRTVVPVHAGELSVNERSKLKPSFLCVVKRHLLLY
jgi:predicted RNA binding protein YcfA (HicA-like mRNA interferase family)